MVQINGAKTFFAMQFNPRAVRRRPRCALLRCAGALRYQKTLRGHNAAVYCVAFDKTGRYVVTGSDDRLVKVGWDEAGWLGGSFVCRCW